MKSSGAISAGAGRPLEIEELANRLWIHPVSKVLVGWLIHTRITPNHISMTSVLAAATAAAGFVALQPIPGAVVGLASLFIWHVLDGADGDLARRTGRASASGELIDGVCDHVSQGLVYISLAIVLQRSAGPWAWPMATAAAISHTVQANAYEAGRKTYRHWVYGAVWMRQRTDMSKSLAGLATRAYLAAAAIFSPGESAVEAAMTRRLKENADAADTTRSVYKQIQLNLVKRSSFLGSTGRTFMVVASVFVANPLWFFWYEILALNIVTVFLVEWRRRANREVVASLSGLSTKL